MSHELKPAHSYARIPPNVFNLHSTDTARLVAFYHLVCQTGAACPAEGYTVYEHGYIYDGAYVMDSALEWVPDTVVDYGVAETIKPVIQGVIHGRHQRMIEPSPGKTVVVAKAGFENYGHILTDILPKLVNIGRAGLGEIRLVLPSAMQRYAGVITALLTQAGVPAELEFHSLATLVEAHGIHVFSPVGQHNTRKSTTFLELADRLRALYGITQERRRRIYIPRAKADIRPLADAQAVEAAFVRHGFEAVYPATLDVEGQVRLFASASHVAAPLGAGLANIGWAPPGCDVLLIDPGIGDFYYWDFSCLMRQRFNWVFAGPLRGYTPELSQDVFAIDPGLLGATLRAVYG